MVPFDDLDDEQRISIANDHPNDLDSGPSSPSSVAPSYIRHRRRSKSTSRHRSHTTTDGSTSHLLARLIARDDEVREINALLVVTSERLETESNRANTSERRALEYFNRLRQATEGRDRAEQESARLREELKLYKIQLDNAQKEIYRAQDIINQVSAQKSEAEAEAARARTKARQLHEEKMVMMAHEEGRHRGYKEGLSYARRIGFNEERSRPIRQRSGRPIPMRTVPPDGEDENEEEEDEEESVHSERNDVPLPPRAPPRSSSRQQHTRPESAPPVPVPTLVTPIPPPSSSHEPPRRTRTPSPPTPPEANAYPIPMRLAPSTASGNSVNVPHDGWIPHADPQTSYIQVLAPHNLSHPVPPSHSSHSHELDDHSREPMFAVDDTSYALVRTNDYAPPTSLLVPRPRTPSLLSKSSSTHMSQYELVSAPTERQPNSLRHHISSTYTRSGSQPERQTSSRGPYGHERNHREEFVEQWRADPEVVATATPGTAIRDFEMVQSGSDRPRESIMSAAHADIYNAIRTEAQPPRVTAQQKSPPRLRNPLDYIRHRFQRTQSTASVPDITVQSPSETASSLSEHARHPSRSELLSPESAHRALPPTQEERPRTSGSHSGDTYRSTTPSQPPWPIEFISMPGRSSSGERDSQYSRSRSRGADEHYQMSPIPEGIIYPDTPLRGHSSQGHRRSKDSELSSSPAPLQRPISLFSDPAE